MNRAVNDYVSLYDYFMDKSIDHQTFESISSTIQKKFNKNDFLSVGTLLTLLIRQGELSSTVQRISGFYVLNDIFRNDGQTETPFMGFFLNLLEGLDPALPKLNIIEKNFILQITSSNPSIKDIGKQTPLYVLQSEMIMNPSDLTHIKQIVMDKLNELPLSARKSTMNIVPAPTLFPSENKIRPLMEGLINADSPLKNVLTPQFMTIAPPLLSCEDELVWFDLTNPSWHKPLYDNTMCLNISSCSNNHNSTSSNNNTNNHKGEAKYLITQAFEHALNLQDQQALIKDLEKDVDLVNNLGLTPAKLPNLVENNPLIAIEILLHLMNSPEITEYFSVLVNMELSLHSMEVVNRLTTSVDLPTEFVHLYICNCISTCETIKDKYMQNRLVRLVCVFLQSLIRNKIVNVKDLTLEVEAFCVEFSRIKEAAALYRLLRQLELGEISIGNLKTKE